LGFSGYRDEEPFHPTMFVHFRKRFGKKAICRIIEKVNQKARATGKKAKDDDKDDDSGGSGAGGSTNQGKLLIDATCTLADITFPTDIKILNEARVTSERVIDILHCPHRGKLKKPRTYRKKARKQFLSIAKAKKVPKSKMRKAIRQQLGYLRRNLKTIDKLSQITSLLRLKKRMYKLLLVISEVYRQQRWMYEQKVNRIDDRIVNIYQPHVRRIKRGKAGAATEFGAKISVSAIDGYCYLDRFSWDAYNESGDLIDQAEAYRDRFGCYPVSIHADKIYRSRDNIRFCKKHGIRLSWPALGRPPTQVEQRKAAQKQVRQDELDRIPIEGKFGQGKRRFSLSKIMSKLDCTSETAIAVVFLVMNLEKWLTSLLFSLFLLLRRLSSNDKCSLQSHRPILKAYEFAIIGAE
jgi:hypothetical protein